MYKITISPQHKKSSCKFMFRVNCWFCLQALCRGSLVSWGFFSPNGAALDHIRSLCQSGMVCIFCFQIIRPMGACYMSDLFHSSQVLGKKILTAKSVHKTVKGCKLFLKTMASNVWVKNVSFFYKLYSIVAYARDYQEMWTSEIISLLWA